MTKFRTTIKHKAGSSIEIFGITIELVPDEDGFCEFEVTDDAVVGRLLTIPEGFAVVDDAPPQVPKADPEVNSIIMSVDGEDVDLSTLDQKNLLALSKHLGLTLHHKTNSKNLIEAIIVAETIRIA